MMRSLAVCLFLGMALAACTPQSSSPVAGAIPVAYAISADSAGPIGATTGYSRSGLQALFPGDRIEVIQTASEEGVVSALAIFEEGLQTLLVLPSAGGSGIKAVHGAGLAVAGPGGERLGMSYGELGIDRSDCRVGRGPWAGMAVCRSRIAPNVSLVFDPGDYNDPGELAPESSLRKGELQRIVWTPPGA